MNEGNLDQVYMSVESDITSLKAKEMTESTVLPKFKLTVSSINHTELNASELIFPESAVGIDKTDHQSLKSFLIERFIDKIKDNKENRKISDLFLETFSVVATDPKTLNGLRNEAIKVEREILLQNGELKPIEKIKHYLNKLVELIFGAEKFLSAAHHSKMSSFVSHISDQNAKSTIRGR
jgi:hypothetical protein